MDEFALICRYFSRDTDVPGVATGVGDDGAVLDPTPGTQQIQVIDTLVEGVHFPETMDPADVGYRVVAVNLSDIAAMGARPRWMTLALTLAGQDEPWVDAFAAGLYAAAAEHGVALVGGDTTSGPAVVVTVHLSGEVESGRALLRSGAQPGDGIFVTGTVGDAAAGLELIRQGDTDNPLARRFLRPSARIAAGQALVGRAHAAIDLSDGLVGDLRKLLTASGVGGELDIGRVPLSADILARFDDEHRIAFALTGGDDYELCFTASPEAVSDLADITRIGTVTAGPDLVCRRNGDVVDVDDSGYRHFT